MTIRPVQLIKEKAEAEIWVFYPIIEAFRFVEEWKKASSVWWMQKNTAALIINEAVGMAMGGSVSESISYLEMIKRINIGINSWFIWNKH